MKAAQSAPRTIDEYIANFPAEVQAKLQSIRETIHRVAPDADEAISYQMPTFKLHGNLVHFAAYAKHIGFYPTPSGIANFSKELARYKTSKGAIQFPLDQPIPHSVIRKIVKFRVKENCAKAVAKRKKS